VHDPQVAPSIDSELYGLVFRRRQGEYGVSLEGRTVTCGISNALRKELVYHTAAACRHPRSDPRGCPRCRPRGAHRSVVDVAEIRELDPVAVGDMVCFVPTESSDRGVITQVLPRRNTLVRRAAGPKRLRQLIAANVDQLLAVVAAASPHPSWNLLDRYLAAAEESEVAARVVITKIDLVDASSMVEELDDYRRIGHDVFLTSAPTGEGIDELRAALFDRVSVFAGKSGVGKTTLLNTLQPGLGQRVGEIISSGPATGKGKHTTSHVEMFELSGGGAIVDTPGMREFGLWETATGRQRQEHEEGDLALLFPDLKPFVGSCRFGLDCSHVHEPRCAIRDAVAAGDVSERRYHSYLRLAGRA
jgi:ribosome biogenesis GTPase / thiamine phosphate phosphatase